MLFPMYTVPLKVLLRLATVHGFRLQSLGCRLSVPMFLPLSFGVAWAIPEPKVESGPNV